MKRTKSLVPKLQKKTSVNNRLSLKGKKKQKSMKLSQLGGLQHNQNTNNEGGDSSLNLLIEDPNEEQKEGDSVAEE